MAVVVTVGRDVKGIPMDTIIWTQFQEEVLAVVERWAHNGEVYFRGTGTGWSESWGYEDAFTVIAAEPWYSEFEEKLREELYEVGRYYGQEAVAVTVGPTTFV